MRQRWQRRPPFGAARPPNLRYVQTPASTSLCFFCVLLLQHIFERPALAALVCAPSMACRLVRVRGLRAEPVHGFVKSTCRAPAPLAAAWQAKRAACGAC